MRNILFVWCLVTYPTLLLKKLMTCVLRKRRRNVIANNFRLQIKNEREQL